MRRLLFATTALVPLGVAAASANPLGGSVVGGSAAISGTGTANVTVNQNTQNAVINWNSFNIGAGERTQFVQPNSTSTVLNRVTGDVNASQIYGTLNANGRVFLTNPYGVLIGNGAVINTAGFLATSHDISNTDFMAGRYNFNIPGRPDASVVNLGTITASNAGFAALVAPGVRNSGTITATFGKIGLASGNGFSLDLYGDKLIQLGVSDQIAATVKDVATGQTLKSLVQNDGKLAANGGRVELSAVSARQVVDSVINTSGVIEARSIGRHAGKIVLGGPTAGIKLASAATQTVKVSGKLDASSRKGKGGKVEIIGEHIQISDASINASGATGGGTVLIGGDVGGGKGNPLVGAPLESYAIPNASVVTINGNTVIDASARLNGDGGKVVVWSDQTTSFAGSIVATGGAASGNGGFAEVSGKNTLDFRGSVDLRAPNGAFGTLLLDPPNFRIGRNDGGPNSISSAALQGQLAKSDVVISTTSNGVGEGNGDILVLGNVTWGQNTTLTLSALHDIIFNGEITVSNTGAGNLVLRADNTGGGKGTLFLNAGSVPERVDWRGSTGQVSIYYNPIGGYTTPQDFSTGNGRVAVNSASQLTSYMLVNTAANLQNISTNLAGTYALGKDIDAGSIPNFTPLNTFAGKFDGQGHTISNLNIAPVNPVNFGIGVGMFTAIGASGEVKSLNFNHATIAANPNATGPGQFVGVLAGTNAGKVTNVTVDNTSTVSAATALHGVIAGGLVGQNGDVGQNQMGTITNSSSAANVMLGNASSLFSLNAAGGLVGSNPGTIEFSSASGKVTVGTNSVAGGLVGQNGDFSIGGGPFGPGIIRNSSASGNVTAGLEAGGLVGFNNTNGTIQDSSASGNVSATQLPSGNCAAFSCQNAHAGGLVGLNSGAIFSTNSNGNPADFFTFATGAVNVASGGVAGGLVGFNNGLIATTFASGAVTGNAGLVNADFGQFGQQTVLGGLVGTNQGFVVGSRAIGNVGSVNTDRLLAGGLVGDNTGTTLVSSAAGDVSAGNFSQAGGLAGTTVPGDACNNCGGGSQFFNTAGLIVDSFSTGKVTVGTDSVAGGFAGVAGFINNSQASGSVTGGGNSILGGFVGLQLNDGLIQNSSASGPVTGTGANNWIGGFVGANIGTIQNSTASGAASGGSDSNIGGFVGVNLGSIGPASANGPVSATGTGNVVGGFVGTNFGTIDQTTATGPISAPGADNIVGGVAGANAQFVNVPSGQLPFPGGTITNSSGPGSTPIGVNSPTTLPTAPALITQCDQPICQIFINGDLGGGPQPPQPPQPPLEPPQLPLQPPLLPLEPPQLPSLVAAQIPIPSSVLAPPTGFNLLPPQGSDSSSSSASPSVLIALTNLATAGPAGGGPGAGGPAGAGVTGQQPSGSPTIYLGAQPGQPGFTPPPLNQRLGPDGFVPSGMPPPGETRFIANNVLMQLSGDAMGDEVRALLESLNIRVISLDPLGALGGSVARLELPPGLALRQAMAILEARQFVPLVTPNYIFMLTQPAAPASKGDPAQYLIGKFELEKTHKLATGKGVTIAVIDSEVDKRHTELQGKISEELDTLTTKEPPHSHGTAMAGAIASRDRLLGVAPEARIIAVRAFGEANNTAEGTSLSIVKGLEWAISQNARVINMSFAGPRDPALERALKATYDKGVIMVGAAGNAGPKSPPLYPGADPHVISVTATDVKDRGFRGANQGPQLSVAAPGVEVLAPAPEENYQMSTGTSIATAHVSGVVALMLERNPRLTPTEVRRILEETATDLGPKGKDAQFGWGLVNPQKALQAAEARIKSSDAGKP